MSTDTKPTRVNVMHYEGKDHLLRVVRTQRAAFWDLVDSLDDQQWQAETPCTEWQVRDQVGHLIDVTEAYLERWAIARTGKPFPDALGLRVMPRMLDEGAKRLRTMPRKELIARLKASSNQLFDTFEALTAEQWTGELIPHVYMGPLPTFFYPWFQLIDYTVHHWDVQQGLGIQEPLDPDAAGTLVPVIFIVLQNTLDAERAQGVSLTSGIRVPGPYGGEWRVQVANNQCSYQEGSAADCPVVFDFDSASEWVLTGYQRIPGGKASGDKALAEQFRTLFFKI